jgi:hypothetical protein
VDGLEAILADALTAEPEEALPHAEREPSKGASYLLRRRDFRPTYADATGLIFVSPLFAFFSPRPSSLRRPLPARSSASDERPRRSCSVVEQAQLQHVA